MVTLAPGLLIAITAVALNLLGDSVRNALDPKARLRGAA
jgi:peptide/nickel transport system permease protein